MNELPRRFNEQIFWKIQKIYFIIVFNMKRKTQTQPELPPPIYHVPANPLLPTLSIRLKVEIKTLERQRAELALEREGTARKLKEQDIQIARLDQILLALKSDDRTSAEGPASGRISKSLGKMMRDTAAGEIRAWMESFPKGTKFTRQQMEARISPSLRYHWGKMLNEWNSAHQDRQIKDNGLDRNKRHYFV